MLQLCSADSGPVESIVGHLSGPLVQVVVVLIHDFALKLIHVAVTPGRREITKENEYISVIDITIV